jgi:hypothetical protein
VTITKILLVVLCGVIETVKGVATRELELVVKDAE